VKINQANVSCETHLWNFLKYSSEHGNCNWTRSDVFSKKTRQSKNFLKNNISVIGLGYSFKKPF